MGLANIFFLLGECFPEPMAEHTVEATAEKGDPAANDAYRDTAHDYSRRRGAVTDRDGQIDGPQSGPGHDGRCDDLCQQRQRGCSAGMPGRTWSTANGG